MVVVDGGDGNINCNSCMYKFILVLIDFDSPEAMKAFATDEELKAKRVAAGAILESNVVTVMGDESFMS